MFHVSVTRYAPNKLSKIAWKQIENGAPELFIFLQTFSFHVDEYELMIEFYAEKLRSGQSSTFSIACDWLNHEVPNRWKLRLAFRGLIEIFPRYKNNETITWYENWEGFIYRYCCKIAILLTSLTTRNAILIKQKIIGNREKYTLEESFQCQEKIMLLQSWLWVMLKCQKHNI